MSSLEDLFCSVDDFCQNFEPQWECQLLGNGLIRGKRSRSLCLSEIVTIAIPTPPKPGSTAANNAVLIASCPTTAARGKVRGDVEVAIMSYKLNFLNLLSHKLIVQLPSLYSITYKQSRVRSYIEYMTLVGIDFDRQI